MKLQMRIGVALAAMILTASAARASLVMNLRFADGSTTHNLTAADVGQDIEMDVWATVTGNNPPSANNFFGLNYVYYVTDSTLPNGVGTGVNGAIDANANALIFPFSTHGDVGKTQDINGDGVADVGSTTVQSDISLAISFIPPNNSSPVFDDNPLAVGNALSNGYEFEIEKLYFHVNSLALGETDFTTLPVSLRQFGPENVPANWNQDSTTDTGSGSPASIMNGAYFSGTTVRFVSVPEPTGVLALVGMVGLIMRPSGSRRRR